VTHGQTDVRTHGRTDIKAKRACALDAALQASNELLAFSLSYCDCSKWL